MDRKVREWSPKSPNFVSCLYVFLFLGEEKSKSGARG